MEKEIENARMRKRWVSHQYSVEESCIVWMGGNMFYVVKNGETFKAYA